MIDYEFGILIGIFAYVYACILTDEEQLLNGVYNWLEYKLIDPLTGKKHWVFNILIGCEKCIAGQIALWLFLYKNIHGYILYPFDTFLKHIFFITFTIFVTVMIKKIHKYKKQNS